MKANRWIVFALVACFMAMGASVGNAQKKAEKSSFDVDGYVWMHSKASTKRAFLLGAESALVLEYHIRTKHSQKPSKFVRNSVIALRDMSWQQIANTIDTYYRTHPKRMNRNVFWVIWHEIILPKVKE